MDKKSFPESVIHAVPRFRGAWESYLAYWDGNTPGPVTDFSTLAEFTHESILSNSIAESELQSIFDIVEDSLSSDDVEESNAVATGFLEYLMNSETTAKHWVPHLGPESIKFCKAWDAFTGVKTEGL